MKRVISTPRFVLLVGYVLLLTHASAAEMRGGLKNATIAHRQRHREARRLARTNQHGPSRPVKGVDRPDDKDYSPNWAGAWQANIPGGTGTFNAVTAQWEIPGFISPPDPGAPYDLTWEVTAFIGIDGSSDACPALFQAGTITNAVIDDDGNFQTEVVAFIEWFPDPDIELDFYVDIGHTVQVNIQALSSSRGTVNFINLSTGDSTGASLTAPSGNNICGLTADWIVENAPLPDGTPSPFLPFNPYNFQDCVAGTTSDLTTDLNGATEVYMFDDNNGNGIAYPTIDDANSLTVYYGVWTGS